MHLTISGAQNLHLNIYQQPMPDIQGIEIAGHALHFGVDGSTSAAEKRHAAAASSSLTPPAHGEVWPGQGGHYICTLPALFDLPARHLIISPEQGKGLTWGGSGEDTPVAGSQYDGRTNTVALLDDDEEHPAARFASQVRTDGHADFYLPSRLDLLMVYICAPQLLDKTDWYWSSSQTSRHFAWAQHPSDGYSNDLLKDYTCFALAARQIHLTA